eukprot:981111-Amphidinium_carterae.1
MLSGLRFSSLPEKYRPEIALPPKKLLRPALSQEHKITPPTPPFSPDILIAVAGKLSSRRGSHKSSTPAKIAIRGQHLQAEVRCGLAQCPVSWRLLQHLGAHAHKLAGRWDWDMPGNGGRQVSHRRAC